MGTEKARLKMLVKSFIAEAITGVQCDAIDLSNGAVASAVYYIDRNLKVFSMKPRNKAERLRAQNVKLSSIANVFEHKDLDGASDIRSMHGVAVMSALQRQQLVIIKHID